MKWMVIAKGNFKKKKIEMAVVFLLVAMTFMIFYLSFDILYNLDAVQERLNEAMNGADAVMVSANPYREEILELLAGEEAVAQSDAEAVLFLFGSSYYRNGDEENSSDVDFMLTDTEWNSELSRPLLSEGEPSEDGAGIKALKEIKDVVKALEEKDIILPYYLKVGEGYRVGDTITVKYNDKDYDFEVAGFTEDIFFATPANVPIYKCLITPARMRELRERSGGLDGNVYLYTVGDETLIDEVDNRIGQRLESEIPEWQQGNNMILNKNQVKMGGAINAQILMAVAAVFALMLLLIAIFVIRFSLNNSLEINLKNIGMLQALGYTAGQLGRGALGEIMLVTGLGIGLGLTLAQQTAAVAGNIIAASIGIRWRQGFAPSCALVGAVIIILLVLGCTMITVRRYGRIAPLEALREGTRTASFKKNRLPLSRSPLPLNFGLGLKNILQERRKSIAMALIVAILSLASNIGLIIYQNFVLRVENIVAISGMEVADAHIMPTKMTPEAVAGMVERLGGLAEIKDILQQNSGNLTVSYQDKSLQELCEFYDAPEKLTVDKVVAGHLPQAANEVMLSGLICKELGVKLGEVVYLEFEGQREAFLLTGICQQISYLGRSMTLSYAGGERLMPSINAARLYCYANEGVSYQELAAAINAVYPELNVQDSRANSLDMVQSIADAMTAVCLLFMIITVMVVFLVIFMLTKTKMAREQRQNGIYKALGYTTGQLINQTVMSYLPVVAAGALTGGIASFYLINPMLLLILSMFGFRSAEMALNPLCMLAAVAAITALAAFTAALAAAGLRALEPNRLIRENG